MSAKFLFRLVFLLLPLLLLIDLNSPKPRQPPPTRAKVLSPTTKKSFANSPVGEGIAPQSLKKMPKKTANPVKEDNIQLGPQAREGENVFGVAHIFASFNDTFVVFKMI